MKIVVGLGNPGRQYVATRHNVGFEVIDRLAVRLGWTEAVEGFDRIAKSRFDALTMDGKSGSAKVLLLKPLTFMNLSGRSLQAAAAFYQVSPEEILVVSDDVALPTGRLRMRASGSSGGHNGLKDIERALGTDAYPRLRIGIDSPPVLMVQRDYVLGRFDSAQRGRIEPALDRAVEAVEVWINKGIVAAMSRFNPSDKKDADAGT